MKKYGSIISKLRKEHGLTQEQLGKELNVSFQAVSKWENNMSEPDLETIEKLTALFGISMSEFFDMANGTKTPTKTSDYKNNGENNRNFIKNKPWYLVAGMGVLILILALCAFLIPVKLSSQQVFNKYESSVFYISARDPHSPKSGTGFFINNSGLAVTTYSNLEDCKLGIVKLSNGQEYFIKTIVGVDEENDIAIIQVDIKKSNPVKIGNSNKLKLGDKVFSITYSANDTIDEAKSVITEGIVFKVESSSGGAKSIQTTASIDDANKGGIILNEYGEVVGIITDNLRVSGVSFDMVNVCYPINKVKNIERTLNKTMEEYIEMHKTFYFYSDGVIIGRQDFISGEKISQISDPIKTGYTFGGWYTSESYETEFDFSTPVTNLTTCYAKWSPNTYTIRFNANGGEGTMNDIIVTYDEELTLPNNLYQLQHYNFKGWKQQDKEITFENNDIVKNLTTENNGLIILNALWEIQKYTISFNGNNSNDGVMENIILEYDQKINLPSNQFSKTGYLFNGWTYNGQTYQDTQEVSKLCESEGTIELLAEWKPITYTIRFTFEGESYDQDFIYDEPKQLLPVAFNKEYFNFSSWYCGTAKDYIYHDQDEILNLTETQGEIFVFSANFAEYTYSIRYNPEQEIDLENCEIITYRYSEERQTPGFVFSKTGYKFVHWIDDDGNIYENKYVVNDGVGTWVGDPICKLSPIDKDIINFYAIWEENTYTAYYKYELKNETKYTKIGTKTYEEKFMLSDPEYVDDGYEFTNWELYSKTYSQNETVSRLTWTDKSTVYILAKYQPKQYLVNFDGNEETSGEMLPISATFDHEVIIPENSFIKDGYTFIGWQFNDNFYTTTDIGIPISTYTDNITLTACWVENLKGEGTFTNPYMISTVKDLDTLANLTIVNQFENCYVSLTNDIDCEFTKLKEINFAGTFEGNGYKLINVDYANGALFKENSGIIRNLSIENLKINIEDINQDTYIAGLVKSNRGFISRCYVKGTITIQSAGNINIFGLVGSNIHNYSYGVIQRQIEFCFAELNVDILSENDINKCVVYGFAGGHNYAVDYNYSILNLTAELKNVNNLTINPFGSKNNHSFSLANINVSVDEVTNYNFKQTSPYYSDDSSIKLSIGGKSVPNLVETTIPLSNLTNKDWMENNLFDIKGVWIYDSEHLPTPSYTHQTVIDTQEQFLALNDNTLFGEYILNCDIDLIENTSFKIMGNYGVFNGNGHIIRNYTLKESEYENIYALFQTNHGIIKNLGIENLNIGFTARKKMVAGAGLIYENYGIVNSCYVKGSISISNIDGDAIAGGIVAISKGGKVLNSYSDVSVYACSTSDVLVSCYAGGIIAMGEGVVENCYSLKGVSSYAHYARGTIFSAYGISGADGIVKNSFVLSNVSVSQYSSISEYQIGGIGKEYENSFAYEWQTIKKLEEDLSFGDKSYEELCSATFLESLDFKLFISEEDLIENDNNVWVISETNLPQLWFEKEE